MIRIYELIIYYVDYFNEIVTKQWRRMEFNAIFNGRKLESVERDIKEKYTLS